MSATRDVIADLRRLDPARGTGDQLLDDRAAHDLQAALSRSVRGQQQGTSRLVRSRRPLVAVVAVAALTILTLIGLPAMIWGGQSNLAYATPRLLPFEVAKGGSAGPGLKSLEQRVGQAQGQTIPGGGQLVRTESWSLSSRIDKGRTVQSAVVPELRELRWTTDRSGHLRSVTGPPQFPGQQYERAWQKDGGPAGAETVIRDESFGPGGFNPMYPIDLSANPQRLLAQLAVGHPAEHGSAELFVAVRDLYLEQSPSPNVRAAMFGLLRQRSDIVSLGSGTDRAGRTGAAFATDSDYSGLPTRYVLLFDSASGGLLASEEILTTQAGKLNVPVPSVISYTTFLTTR